MTIKRYTKALLSFIISFTVILAASNFFHIDVNADDYCDITYEFTGDNADTPGYAEGTVTLTANNDGEYKLYWAGDQISQNVSEIEYSPILECTLAAGESASVDFGYHTAIPVQADGLIAFVQRNENYNTVAAVYRLPNEKLLVKDHSQPLYTFCSYSDVHMDCSGFYTKSKDRWSNALEFASDKNADFIITSGDMVTNNQSYDRSNCEREWRDYLDILNRSSYSNPIWESDGNHDMHTIGKPGLKYFIDSTGTNDLFENFDDSYYYIIEPRTGDLFIFMALEESSDPKTCDEFTLEQRYWVEDLLNQYYGTGINIYIVEHAPIEGFGAGDRMENPYYIGMLKPEYESTRWLQSILTNYKGIIHMSGHTHEDFCMNYNYSDENGTACNMIHNPSVACTTMPNKTDDALDYNGGLGNGSQGYYVEVYKDNVIYYGVDLTEGLIYPLYSYIMEGTRGLDIYGQPYIPETPDDPFDPYADIVPISSELADAKEILDYYEGASFTLHQKLKMLYNTYRKDLYAPEYIRDEITAKTAELRELYEALGVNLIYPVGDTYYFVNTKHWNNVYAYAYRLHTSADANNNDIRNGIWPGVKMKKVGTMNGSDVFRIRFDYPGQYDFITFTNGTSNTESTALYFCKNNCFTMNDDSSTYNNALKNIPLDLD